MVVMSSASPLVKKQFSKSEELDLLDHQKEFSNVIDALRKTEREVIVKKVPGTLERFQQALSDQPDGFHFGGHGTKDKFLLFETSEGEAHFVSQEELKKFIKQSSLKFAFIASCHS